MSASPCEIAWAAGLFEGEGSSTICRGRVRLQLHRFHRIVGRGKVYGPYTGSYTDGHERKPRVLWMAECEDASIVARLLHGWLSERRRARIEDLFLVQQTALLAA